MNASFFIRLKAFGVDYILIALYLIFLLTIGVFLFPNPQSLISDSFIKSQIFSFLILTLPVSLYFIIFDSSLGKQTVGKRLLGIQVVNQHGAPLSIKRSIIRTSLKFLPWELSHFLVYRFVYVPEQDWTIYVYLVMFLTYGLIFIYLLTAIFTKHKQSLYDLLTKTEVIKK
ncbi:RDD family protein [Tenuibacillus multivorans]|uniref:RDD family protein n=1 Tax=Tenuibacillus multivorans TaxID=237069 RepID=A0A1H0AKB6_9BACI|nr:RDD family protein [Tenuibacillus multivorans]SDN34022.1 RDD family protein [Tenuibacillus multivorans]